MSEQDPRCILCFPFSRKGGLPFGFILPLPREMTSLDLESWLDESGRWDMSSFAGSYRDLACDDCRRDSLDLSHIE